MNTIWTRNVHTVLPVALDVMMDQGIRRSSRNGPVRQVDGPVATVYKRPWEQVSFWAERDANPFFHFFEKLWMLGGKFDVKSVGYFAKNMQNYSDDGETFWGSYGRRWRHGISYNADQLPIIIDRLKTNPTDRRCVLSMWEAASDLGNPGKDVPCNLTITFQTNPRNQTVLDMVVFNRSNDIIWGAYGANAVHMAALHEYVAHFSGLIQGTYTQISVNWHAYDAVFDDTYRKFYESAQKNTPEGVVLNLDSVAWDNCPYTTGEVKCYPMIALGTSVEEWEQNLAFVLRSRGRAPAEGRWHDPFFPDVVLPILRAHDSYKSHEGAKRYELALKDLGTCHASDWRRACEEWITRRYRKWSEENDDRSPK